MLLTTFGAEIVESMKREDVVLANFLPPAPPVGFGSIEMCFKLKLLFIVWICVIFYDI
jgi:hypothetical protein